MSEPKPIKISVVPALLVDLELLAELRQSDRSFLWTTEWSFHGKRQISEKAPYSMPDIERALDLMRKQLSPEDQPAFVIEVEFNQFLTVKLLARRPGDVRPIGVYMAQTEGNFSFKGTGHWRYVVFSKIQPPA